MDDQPLVIWCGALDVPACFLENPLSAMRSGSQAWARRTSPRYHNQRFVLSTPLYVCRRVLPVLDMSCQRKSDLPCCCARHVVERWVDEVAKTFLASRPRQGTMHRDHETVLGILLSDGFQRGRRSERSGSLVGGVPPRHTNQTGKRQADVTHPLAVVHLSASLSRHLASVNG
jgi:hypothetical protein